MAMSAKHGKDPVIFALKEKPSLLLIIKTYWAALDDLDGGEDADYMEDSRVVQIHMCELSKPGIAWVRDELWIAGEKKWREKEKKLNHMRNLDLSREQLYVLSWNSRLAHFEKVRLLVSLDTSTYTGAGPGRVDFDVN